jgi:hypothetical protein
VLLLHIVLLLQSLEDLEGERKSKKVWGPLELTPITTSWRC